MGQNDKDQLAKFVCFAIGCLIAYYILMALLPFIEIGCAIIGAMYLFNLYNKGNRR